MPYIINKYDGTELTVLEDGTIDTTTSLGLVGRNYFGYGETQNENFVYLLENFSNPNPPLRPVKGQTWFDSTQSLLKVYNGSQWVVVGSAVLSETEPENASNGSFWLKTPSNTLYVWNGATWMFVGPESAEGFGTTRAESTTLLDSTNVQRPVILIKVNNTVVSIISETSFTINSSVNIPGFLDIEAGVTMSADRKFRGTLKGTADRAQRLDITRTINGVGFNGESNITIKAATTNKLEAGTYVLGDDFDGSSPETWSVDASASSVPNKIVARDFNGDFSARRITAQQFIGNLRGNVDVAEGTSNFNVISANSFIGATLTGNAGTASRLETPRAINGVLFDGTVDIEVPANAQTLSGTFIKSTVQTSNLTQVGKLLSLSVEDTGITVGATTGQGSKFFVAGGAGVLVSDTGTLKIGGSGNAEFSFLSAAEALAQGGPASRAALIPNTNANIGLPSKKIRTIYVDQVEGNSATATLAASSTNLAGGGPGSLPYQTSNGVTGFLPTGTPGYYLRVSGDNSIVWSPIVSEKLDKGSHIIFTSFGDDADYYDAQSQTTISVDATSTNVAGKIVVRDGSGNFSASRITLTQEPTLAQHAVTKSYVDDSTFVATYGNTVYSIAGYTNQVGSWNNNANYFDVFPPAGRTMADLVAFIPSIAVIHYAGGVNGDDSMRCTWSDLGDRIRVWVQNTEQRSKPAGNFLALWR